MKSHIDWEAMLPARRPGALSSRPPREAQRFDDTACSMRTPPR